jgi:hypothetical protein
MIQRVTGGLPRLQHGHGLNVCSMRKHVDGLKRNNTIAVCADSGQFASEGLWITGHVGHAPGLETAEDLTQDRSRAPFARRIQDHGLGIPE